MSSITLVHRVDELTFGFVRTSSVVLDRVSGLSRERDIWDQNAQLTATAYCQITFTLIIIISISIIIIIIIIIINSDFLALM